MSWACCGVLSLMNNEDLIEEPPIDNDSNSNPNNGERNSYTKISAEVDAHVGINGCSHKCPVRLVDNLRFVTGPGVSSSWLSQAVRVFDFVNFSNLSCMQKDDIRELIEEGDEKTLTKLHGEFKQVVESVIKVHGLCSSELAGRKLRVKKYAGMNNLLT